ncbi:hypothetical protein LTR04_003325 [Oleoguttula sp. CCFEE 6159]|nr:hypothetical protein LTR04_003325 [Oleoguttula sp. CCFEE 6159]
MTSTFLAWAVISLFILPAFSSSSSTSSSSTSASAPPARKAIKSESVKSESEEDVEGFDADNLSDTSRTFPTYSRQPPLHYSAPRPRIKKEEEDAEADQHDESERYRYIEQVGEEGEEGGYGELDDALAPLQTLSPQPWTTGEADDEDEKDEEADAFMGDSGLGTSMESSVDGSARRRKGRRGGGKRSEG